VFEDENNEKEKSFRKGITGGAKGWTYFFKRGKKEGSPPFLRKKEKSIPGRRKKKGFSKKKKSRRNSPRKKKISNGTERGRIIFFVKEGT